jgi:hypothetical protein
MSHHLDSPQAREDVRLDITDLYVFRGETGTVLVINVCHSIAGDIPTPGFHPEARYEFKIDTDGDAIEDLAYRVTFGERRADGRQRLVVQRFDGIAVADESAAGEVIVEGLTGETIANSDGLRLWVGRTGDPFWIEPDVLQAVGHAFQDGTTIDLSGWDHQRAHNLFAGHTAYSVVLELPDSALLEHCDDDRRINVWALSRLATDAGGWRQINRVGLPMIHPLFTQFDDDLGDRLNQGVPNQDLETYGDVVIAGIAGVVSAYGTSDDPQAYAETVARRCLPNVLPYIVGTPAAFGFASWNGRSLTDNAPEVMFSIASNTPVSLGIGKESVTAKPSKTFPYVQSVTPTGGSVVIW